MCPSYEENYCLCLLICVCEDVRNMFLCYAGSHVPGYTVSKRGIPQNYCHPFENFNVMYQILGYRFLPLTYLCFFNSKIIQVKQSLYRPGQAVRVSGG